MKKLNLQKGIAPIIAVILLAILAVFGGTYYFKQQQTKQVPTSNITDETANWKTYTNNDYQFSFKYPQKFTLEKVTKQPSSTAITNQYVIEFNTGKIPQSQPPALLNTSGLIITVVPTNGKTLSQYIPTNLGDAKIIYLEKTGEENEIAKMIDPQKPANQAFINGYIRKEPYIFILTHSQNNLTKGGGGKGDSEDILTYIDQILSTFKFTDLDRIAFDSFYKAYKEKYPRPSPQPIPSGLEDQLFTAYNRDLIQSGEKATARYNFSLRDYYGDSAEGSIGYATEPNGFGGGATWTMNKINGKWIIIFPGRQEAPMCDDAGFKSVINELRDWQGSCYVKIDEYPYSKIIDGKHPDESYNNY